MSITTFKSCENLNVYEIVKNLKTDNTNKKILKFICEKVPSAVLDRVDIEKIAIKYFTL